MQSTHSAKPSSPRPLAVVTGASSGIGEAFARKLAPTHDLLLVARRRDRLDAVASEVAAAHGTRAEVLVADLTLETDVAGVGKRIRADPNLELLVNNAGFGVDGLFWEGALSSNDRMHRLHILATLSLCHAALGNLVPRNRGAIVNVASVAAFVRGIGTGSYGATKSWMTAFTEGLHLDLRSIKSKVIVQALCPGFTYTEFHDAMGVHRDKRAPRSFWLSADSVVAASLAGLRSGRLFVVPDWKYKLVTAILTKLPTRLRVAFELSRTR
jgi:short-subunit dehydrogenase